MIKWGVEKRSQLILGRKSKLESIDSLFDRLYKIVELEVFIDIKSSCRKKEYVYGRAIFVQCLWETYGNYTDGGQRTFDYPRMTFEAIGDFLGERDHSTILHILTTANNTILYYGVEKELERTKETFLDVEEDVVLIGLIRERLIVEKQIENHLQENNLSMRMFNRMIKNLELNNLI